MAALLAGCGGGDSGTALLQTAASTTVSGAVVKGPVSAAQVCAFSVAGSARGTPLGSCTTTDANGSYSFAVPAGTGPLWVEATGGTYVDEVTGTTVTLPAGSPLVGLVSANGAAVTAMLTPLTTLALNAARTTAGNNGTLDANAYATAMAQLRAAFNLPSSLDISTTVPTFGAGINSYGTALTAISQMVANGLTLQNILATTQPSTLAAAYATAATQPTAPTPGEGGSLVISSATPASLNGTLSFANAQFEHTSSSETGTTFDVVQPYCWVAVYNLLNSGNGQPYTLEIPFRKTDQQAGLLKFIEASGSMVRMPGPIPGLAIDTANRRMTFTNVVIGGANSASSITLNGTLNYPTNGAPGNRAACG